jgi:DNA-binding response OmpR family regulator
MKPRILVVDDEERMAGVVAMALGRAGWDCEICGDGWRPSPRSTPAAPTWS